MFVEYLTPHIGTEPNQGSYVYAAVPASYAVVSIGITPGPGYGVTGLYPGLIADEYLWPAKGGTTSVHNDQFHALGRDFCKSHPIDRLQLREDLLTTCGTRSEEVES